MRVVTIAVLLAIVLGSPTVCESQSTIYWSKDHIYAGAEGKEIAIVTPPSSDTTAPTAPSSLGYSSVTATSVYLSWTGSTDSGGSGLAGYKVYRQMGSGASLPVGTVGPSTTFFTDQPLQPSTSYTYTVRAFDNAQNHSSPATTVTFTSSSSSGDTIAPSIPVNIQGTPASASISLTWAASTDAGGSGVAGYKVYRGGTLVSGGSLLTTPAFSDTGLSANTSYSYTVTAADNAGNVSSASSAVSVATIRTLIFEDNFDVPDNIYGYSGCHVVWSGYTYGCWNGGYPQWQILGHQMIYDHSYATGWMNNTSAPWLSTDFKATVDIVNNPNSAGIYFWDGYWAYSAPEVGYYLAYVTGTTLRLSFFSGYENYYGVFETGETVLSTATVSGSTGTISVDATMLSRVIKVSFNGTQVINFTETDTNRSNVGRAGIGGYSTTGATSNLTFDNFILRY